MRTTTDRPGDRMEATANLSEVGKRIDALEIAPSSPATNRAIAATLKELADMTTKQGDDKFRKMPRLLCVFSDTTRGSWDPEEASAVETASDLVPPTREALIAARAEIAGVLGLVKEAPEKVAGVVDFMKRLESLHEQIPRWGAADFPLRGERRPSSSARPGRRSARLSKESARQEGDALVRWETALRKTLRSLSGQETLWFEVGMSPLTDVAIVRIDWPQLDGQPVETFAPSDEVKLGVVIEAAGQNFQATLTCEHEAGKFTHPIEVKKGETKSVQFDLRLSELKLAPGQHSVTLSLDARDGWAGDNRRFATFQVREPKRVLVVSDRPERPGELQGALRANRYAVETKTPAEVEERIPANVDAVFLYGLAEPSGDLWRSLERFVRDGGGLGIVPGDEKMKLAAYSYKSPLVAGQASLLPGEFKKVVTIPEEKSKETGETWNFEREALSRHPMLKPFERWVEDENIDFVKYPPRVWTFWEVADKDTLIRYADGKPALLEKSIGAGKVIEFTTTLDPRMPAWNNYLETLTSFYVVLVGQTAKYLTGETAGARCNFTAPGDEPTVWAKGWAGKRVQPIGPGPGKLDAITVPADTVRLAIPQATTPGNYRILDADGKTPLAAFSVNLTTAEVTPARPRCRHDRERFRRRHDHCRRSRGRSAEAARRSLARADRAVPVLHDRHPAPAGAREPARQPLLPQTDGGGDIVIANVTLTLDPAWPRMPLGFGTLALGRGAARRAHRLDLRRRPRHVVAAARHRPRAPARRPRRHGAAALAAVIRHGGRGRSGVVAHPRDRRRLAQHGDARRE